MKNKLQEYLIFFFLFVNINYGSKNLYNLELVCGKINIQ